MKTIPLQNLTKFQVNNDAIIYSLDSKAMSYTLKTTEQNELPLIDIKYKEIRIERGMIYAKNDELIDMLKTE